MLYTGNYYKIILSVNRNLKIKVKKEEKDPCYTRKGITNVLACVSIKDIRSVYL